MDGKVDKYMEKQVSPQKEILLEIRRILHTTISSLDEKMRWGVPTFSGGKFYIVALKDHVNFGFAINGLNDDEIKLFEGKGKTMRHIKIHSLEDIDKKNLVCLIELVNKKATCINCQ
jgi:hypothetical protein